MIPKVANTSPTPLTFVIPKGRGRPRKVEQYENVTTVNPIQPAIKSIHKGRGRPSNQEKKANVISLVSKLDGQGLNKLDILATIALSLPRMETFDQGSECPAQKSTQDAKSDQK